MKLGLIQVDNHTSEGYSERLDRLYDMADEAFSKGADLVFFPESYQYVTSSDILSLPMKLRVMTEEWRVRCSALAKKRGAYLVPWDYEVSPDGRIYNSSYILDRQGVEIGRFRKVHIPYEEMKKGISRGDDFPVFDLDIGRVGIMICFDNYYPESARILGNRGADLILFPLYGDTLKPGWEIKLRARAVDNTLFIASSQIDSDYSTAFTGVVGPDGGIIRKITKAPSVEVVDLDVGARVLTHTSGSSEITEDIRAYLERCRNVSAYGGISESVKKVPWVDIFCGKKPE